MEKASIFLVNKMLERNIIQAEKREIYKTGIELIFADIINFSLILLVGLFTGNLINGCIYIFLMWAVRRFTGGFHAKTYTLCRICTIGIYALIILAGRFIKENLLIYSVGMNLFTILTVIKFAPIRHPNKDLTETEIKANKFFAIISSVFFSAVSAFLISVGRKEGLTISLILFAISILMYVGLITNGKENKIR